MKIRLVQSQLAFALYFLFFSCALTWKVANVALYALILLACIDIVCTLLRGKEGPVDWRTLWPIYFGMCGPVLAIFFNQLAAGNIQIKPYDNASALAFCFFLVWIALRIPLPYLLKLKWAFWVGAVVATIKLAWMTKGGADRLLAIEFVPIIAFAELALLLGLFAWISAGWQPMSRWCAIALASAFLIAMYGAFISQTRAAWLTLPLLLMLGCVGSFAKANFRKSLALTVFAVVLVGAVMSQTHTVQNRMEAVTEELQMFNARTNEDTSIGTRFQLWHGAWVVFTQHPMTGVGLSGFNPALRELSKQGLISPGAAEYPHAHNEFIFNMSILGIWGMFALLALYGSPLFYFTKALNSVDPVIRRTAVMGVGLCSGFVAFGAVDVMFMWRISNVFYPMCLAVFFAIIVKRRVELRVATVKSSFNGSAT